MNQGRTCPAYMLQPLGFMAGEGRIAHILVAEGNREIRASLIWFLLSEGFWVHPVSNGVDAALALEPPGKLDLAIIDLGLRGCDARRVIEGMRCSERLRRVPVIATGLMESFAPLPRDVRFLKKPFDFGELLSVIRDVGQGPLHSFFPSRNDTSVARVDDDVTPSRGLLRRTIR